MSPREWFLLFVVAFLAGVALSAPLLFAFFLGIGQLPEAPSGRLLLSSGLLAGAWLSVRRVRPPLVEVAMHRIFGVSVCVLALGAYALRSVGTFPLGDFVRPHGFFLLLAFIGGLGLATLGGLAALLTGGLLVGHAVAAELKARKEARKATRRETVFTLVRR